MNYYQPLEIATEAGQPSGKWRMTLTNDNYTYAIGYCRERKCEHLSPEEASDCYREYLKTENNGLLPGGFELSEDDKPGTIITFFGSY